MNEDVFNIQISNFLNKVSIISQSEIESSVKYLL